MGRCAAVFTIFWTLLLAVTPVRSNAAPWATADTVFQHVADDNELPNGASPFALAEDGDGFLWEGSDDGLARYDGHVFHAYTADRGRTGSLPDSLILALHTDVRGRLWVGTGAGLARYDRDHDRFVSYFAGPHGLSSSSVNAIADDGDRALWIGTQSGLDHFDLASGRIERVRHVVDVDANAPDSAVQHILIARNGGLWVATDRGLVHRSPGATRFTPVHLPVPRGNLTDVTNLLQDRTGRVWIGTVSQGVFLLEPGARQARALHETRGAPGTVQATDLSSENVTSFVQASPSEIWLGTIGDGIVAVDTRTLRTRRIRHDPLVPNTLLDDSVRVLYRDRAGLIWSGTDRSLSYAILQPGISTIFGPSSRPDGLTDPNVEAILPLSDGHVWLGLGRNGIDIFGPTGARERALRANPQRQNAALPLGQINGFGSDGSHLYIATARGLYSADTAGRHIARMTFAGRDPSADVTTLFANGGVLWFGAADGLWEVRPAASGAHQVLLGGPTSPQLTDRRVSAIVPSPQRKLWIGTKNGLNRYDPRTHVVEHFPAGTGPASLSSGFIATLLTDPAGRLWVGTQGGGIDILEETRGEMRFRRIGTADGLPSANVDTLLDDRRGHIWASTDDGLVTIDERTLGVRALGRADGVAIAGYWWHSGARTGAGDLLFGGLGGMTVVRPRLVRDASYHPPIVFTAIRVGGKAVASGRYASGESSEAIEIQPGANSLAVEFSALEYSAPMESKFAYRLEGFDKNWTFADSTNRLATYTNLPPGNYRLRVRGSNRAGEWSQRESSLWIHVIPAWWQTLWFKLLLLFCLSCGVMLLVRGRTRYLEARQHELEREIAERTAQLRTTNAELAASTAELSKSKIRLETLAYLDGLTELPNRRMFIEQFQSLIAQMQRSDEGRFALILIDLDHFKEINDALGHQAGDALLVEAAARLRATVRQNDIVARFGGDEFAMLIAGPGDWSGIDATCARIVECFATPIVYGGTPMLTTPSIGIATYPHCGETQEALYKAADLALYEAKRSGRNTWRWYVSEMVM